MLLWRLAETKPGNPFITDSVASASRSRSRCWSSGATVNTLMSVTTSRSLEMVVISRSFRYTYQNWVSRAPLPGSSRRQSVEYREMIARTKRSWQHFKNSKQSGGGQLSRIFNIVAGGVLVIFSAFFGWAPGPGTITFIIGLALIGGEFLPVARFLDWAEVRLRELARFVAGVWRSSTIGKVVVVLTALIVVFAVGYVIYSVFFG